MGRAAISIIALACGLAAATAIVARFYLVGFVFVAAYAVLMLFAISRKSATRNATLRQVFDATGVAVVPFAFAVADPSRALAASFLLFGLVACTAAWAECSGTAGQSAASTVPFRSGRAGMSWWVILYLGLAVACLQHEWFSLIAYLLGALGFVAAGVRVAASVTDVRS